MIKITRIIVELYSVFILMLTMSFNLQSKVFRFLISHMNCLLLFHMCDQETLCMEIYHIGWYRILFLALSSALPLTSTNSLLFQVYLVLKIKIKWRLIQWFLINSTLFSPHIILFLDIENICFHWEKLFSY